MRDKGMTNGDRDQDGHQWRGHDDQKNKGMMKAPESWRYRGAGEMEGAQQQDGEDEG
jgi:hypothetical protein